MQASLLMLDVMRAFYWFDEGLQAALRARGWEPITRTQSMTFANLALGVTRPAELARNLGVSRQAVSKMLQDMVERGWVEIRPDPADRRASVVSFSASSQRLRDDAVEILAGLDAVLGERIGADRLADLQATLGSDWGAPPEIDLDPR
ncbi:MarR family winged helix-turn-helix transcriptional regulator [Nocardioides insulae]|uniref:MarR family winged helix-turn-helix transcriptional regulator n=1 Tax=Nocardioides insulae TaxID=394734 RepID=UPI000411D73D|nr:helix-turn-helix domain-containing protein [Nocardioides insulae]